MPKQCYRADAADAHFQSPAFDDDGIDASAASAR